MALSRCTFLEGLILKKPIYARHVWSDEKVVTFVSSLKKHTPSMPLSLKETEELINSSLINQHPFEIIYLNAANEKSIHSVTPTYIGLMKYQNIPYTGIKGFCHASQEDKVFRLDRIMAITENQNLSIKKVS